MNPAPTYVLNRDSATGRALRRWQALESELRRRDLLGPVLRPASRTETISLAAQARLTSPLVVAVGGDGTVADVLTGLSLHPGTPRLAILPLGTGNDAARMLGIRSPRHALDALEQGLSRPLDAIQLTTGVGSQRDTRLGLVVAGAAFAAELLRHTSPAAKRWLGGPLAYALGFFRALRHFHSPHLRMSLDGQLIVQPTPALVCANATTAGGGGMRVAPCARPDDGLLDVLILSGLSRWQLAAQFVRLVRGTHLNHPAVRHVHAREIVIEPEVGTQSDGGSAVPMQLDGDLAGAAPAQIRVLPHHVSVIALPPSREVRS
ncbi:MAG: diacylglycerol kinase family lipid kinase [Verrucomicrobiales bacterium]|nr:diacylglycerol kinase family lipid kinase [Verrucomicrobiales bacterium]